LKTLASVKCATLFVLFASRLAAQQDRIEAGIRDVGPRAVRLALPEFRFETSGEKTDKLAKVFNETLYRDLDFSGNLEIASASFYPSGIFALPSDIKAEEWTRPGIAAQYIAYGRLSLNGTRFTATGRLRDLGTQQEPIASNFPGFNDEEESARLAAHNFSDRILEQLGFGRGIARTKIGFVSNRGGTKEIYTMDYDGTNQHALTSHRSTAITPRWSPVDDRIAYTVWGPSGPQIAITSASGVRSSFTQPTTVSNSIPSWSPDGKSIVYSSWRDGDTEIYSADADGKNAKRLTNSRGIDVSPFYNPATGRRIVFVSDRSGSPQVWSMSYDGTDVQRITDEGGEAANPVYSPDGRLIAFAWNKPRSGGFDIYLYDTQTQKFTQLTSNQGNNERPAFAPDGKHIAFQSNRSGTTQIYSMTLDGKKVLPLTSIGSNEGPTWSGYATP
jgi:TolB protein